MKIAVYAICKNEAKFVSRFAASAKGADGIFVLDTGSTDDTLSELAKAGITYQQQVISPWRFDAARNAALDMVPDDYDACVLLDLDEVLCEGWLEAIEAHFKAGATRVQATYTWAFDDQGKPLLTFFMDRAHARHGYKWVGAVHETVRWQKPEAEQAVSSESFKIHHHADPAKSRGQYLPLLKVAAAEEPHNDRTAFYYARELFNYGMTDEAEKELLRHAAMPHAWNAERACSYGYLGVIHAKRGHPAEAEKWYLRACAEDPESRRHWLDLAQHYLDRQMWEECYGAAIRALRITNRAKTYLDMQECWGALPHDLAGTAAWYIGLKAEALAEMRKAAEFDGGNARINANINLCEQLLKAA